MKSKLDKMEANRSITKMHWICNC